MTQVSNKTLRNRIEEFFYQHEWDVVCRKKGRAYSVSFADCDEPFLRLRPTGQGDNVHVMYWDGDQWCEVTDFGLTLPLDDALEHVAEDPDGVFLTEYEEEEFDFDNPVTSGPNMLLSKEIARLHAKLVSASTIGAAFGSAFHGGWIGLACGAAAGFLIGMVLVAGGAMTGLRLRLAVLFLLPTTVFAATGGLMGSVVHQGIGGGYWGCTIGVVVGFACALLIYAGGWKSWLIGFFGGLNLGLLMIDSVGLPSHFFAVAFAALLAVGLARLFRSNVDWYRSWSMPLVKSFFDHETAAREERKASKAPNAA